MTDHNKIPQPKYPVSNNYTCDASLHVTTEKSYTIVYSNKQHSDGTKNKREDHRCIKRAQKYTPLQKTESDEDRRRLASLVRSILNSRAVHKSINTLLYCSSRRHTTTTTTTSNRIMFVIIYSLMFLFLFVCGDTHEPVTCGSVIKLLHSDTMFHLQSHSIAYGSGSGQQSVTTINTQSDSNSLWLIKESENGCEFGMPVQCGDKIRLEHVRTGKNLHSHLYKAPISSNQEVSGFGVTGAGDTGNNQ